MRRIADGYTVSILHFIVYNPNTVLLISIFNLRAKHSRRSFRRDEDRGCLLCTSHRFDDHYAIVPATVFPKRSRFAMIFARHSSTYSLSCTTWTSPCNSFSLMDRANWGFLFAYRDQRSLGFRSRHFKRTLICKPILDYIFPICDAHHWYMTIILTVDWRIVMYCHSSGIVRGLSYRVGASQVL